MIDRIEAERLANQPIVVDFGWCCVLAISRPIYRRSPRKGVSYENEQKQYAG